MNEEWDVALRNSGNRKANGETYSMLNLNLPAPLGRALREKNMFRAKVRLTEDGILVVPYVADEQPGTRKGQVVQLPDWSTDDRT